MHTTLGPSKSIRGKATERATRAADLESRGNERTGLAFERIGVIRDIAKEGFAPAANKNIEGDDRFALTLEVASAGRAYANASVYRVTGQAETVPSVTYPTLLSGIPALTMTRADAVEELELLLDIGDAADDSGLLVYSLQVNETAAWSWPTGGPTLADLHPNSGRQAEMRIGYLYHEVMREIPVRSRGPFLSWFLGSVHSFDLSLRLGPDAPPLRVRVTLVDL